SASSVEAKTPAPYASAPPCKRQSGDQAHAPPLSEWSALYRLSIDACPPLRYNGSVTRALLVIGSTFIGLMLAMAIGWTAAELYPHPSRVERIVGFASFCAFVGIFVATVMWLTNRCR